MEIVVVAVSIALAQTCTRRFAPKASSIDGEDVVPKRRCISFTVITHTDTRILCAYVRYARQILPKRTSSILREPTDRILHLNRLQSVRSSEMKLLGMSPPDTIVFFPRNTGCQMSLTMQLHLLKRTTLRLQGYS